MICATVLSSSRRLSENVALRAEMNGQSSLHVVDTDVLRVVHRRDLHEWLAAVTNREPQLPAGTCSDDGRH